VSQVFSDPFQALVDRVQVKVEAGKVKAEVGQVKVDVAQVFADTLMLPRRRAKAQPTRWMLPGGPRPALRALPGCYG